MSSPSHDSLRADGSGRRRTRGRTLLALVLSCTGITITTGNVQAEEPAVLSPVEREAIARAFAPVLVFHPLESFLPASSMPPFAADANLLLEDDTSTVAAAPGLEAWRARVARYRAQSSAEKQQQASLGYRVFSQLQRGRMEVVVEYWCYYVFNAFTIRGAWLPYRVRDNHPHDLERLYIVLTPTRPTGLDGGVADEAWARAAFRIRSVIANAHDGSIPPNQYEVPEDDPLLPPVTVLVERGSHAMAPDINHDGRFTPGIDSTRILKLEWGIRDTGSTWGRYRASFMEGRDASAVRLCGPSAAGPQPETDACPRYALYPAGDLQAWFRGLALTSRDRSEIVGRSSWWIRTFGDIRMDELMVPTDPPDGRVLDSMLHRRARGEAGFVVGLTGAAHAPALVLGRRYFRDVPSSHAPDVIAEMVGVFPIGSRPVMEATVWGSYSVDAITNLLLGVGWFPAGRGADMAAGTDLRIGRFRVRPTWRLRDGVFNARVTTTF